MHVVTSAKIRHDLQDRLRNNFPSIRFSFYNHINDALEALSEADVLITYGEDLSPEMIEQAKQLKWIMVISAGLEKMPFQAIKERSIFVTNARGIHKTPMAEYTLAAMLQSAKNMKQWTKNQVAHIWDKTGVKMTELAGEALAIIGPGAIGSEIARLAKAFGMETYGVNRSGDDVPYIDHIYKLKDIFIPLAKAKYVVSVLPHTVETDHLLGTEHFKAMRNDALFINIGRGKTIDQDALLNALANGWIAEAVLDVFEEEPLPEAHPFWDMDNVTITPHFSSVTSGYQPRAIAIFEENLKQFIEGGTNYINLIDLDRGY